MINESIAGYRIIRELGRGGMATVYLAEHELLRKKFAVKVLHYELARNTQIRNRFIKEARLMADMSNVGIVKVNNLIDAGDVVAMVMEYINGAKLGYRTPKLRASICKCSKRSSMRTTTRLCIVI
jgi:serine/threonine-protein kinase